MDELKGKLTCGDIELEVDEEACPPICLDCSHCYVEDGAEYFCKYDDDIPCSAVTQCSKFLKGEPKNAHYLYGEDDPASDEEENEDPLIALLERMENNNGDSIFFGFDSNLPLQKKSKRKKPKGFG